jgi:phosphoribosylaminoimidazole (AIR) synthetase
VGEDVERKDVPIEIPHVSMKVDDIVCNGWSAVYSSGYILCNSDAIWPEGVIMKISLLCRDD